MKPVKMKKKQLAVKEINLELSDWEKEILEKEEQRKRDKMGEPEMDWMLYAACDEEVWEENWLEEFEAQERVHALEDSEAMNEEFMNDLDD